MLYLQLHDGELTHPIAVLESYFQAAGVTIIQAAFTHSYFIHPDSVREKTPYFPERARFSRQHYPGVSKGQEAVWPGDGREFLLDDNQYAQLAWERYTGHRLTLWDRLLHTSHLGAPLGPGGLHGRMEPLLHALLGGNANGKTAPPRRNWRRPSARPRGTCTSGTTPCARDRTSWKTRASTSARSSRASLS